MPACDCLDGSLVLLRYLVLRCIREQVADSPAWTVASPGDDVLTLSCRNDKRSKERTSARAANRIALAIAAAACCPHTSPTWRRTRPCPCGRGHGWGWGTAVVAARRHAFTTSHAAVPLQGHSLGMMPRP